MVAADVALCARVPAADLDGNERGDHATASLTQRARAETCRRVGQDGPSVPAVARESGIGWATAMTVVREHGKPGVWRLRRAWAWSTYTGEPWMTCDT